MSGKIIERRHSFSGCVVKRFFNVTKDGVKVRQQSPYWHIKGMLDGKPFFRATKVFIPNNRREEAASKRLAQDELDTYKNEVWAGNLGWFLKGQEEPPLFSILADDYTREHVETECKPKYRKQTLYRIQKLKDFFGNKPLDQITELTVARWKKSGPAPSVINRQLTDLKAIMNFAVASEARRRKYRMTFTPISHVKPIKTQKDPKDSRKIIVNGGDGNRDIVIPGRPEETAVYRLLAEQAKSLLVWTYSGAFRRDEPLTLRFEQILSEDRLRFIVLDAADSKTEKPRKVPLFPAMERILRSVPHKSGFIFSDDKGASPLSANAWSLRFKRARKEAEKDPDFFFFAIQDLRRSRATHLADAGVPLRQIQLLLGHANLEMTERYLGRTEKSMSDLIRIGAELDDSGCKTGSNLVAVAGGGKLVSA